LLGEVDSLAESPAEEKYRLPFHFTFRAGLSFSHFLSLSEKAVKVTNRIRALLHLLVVGMAPSRNSFIRTHRDRVGRGQNKGT